MEQIFDTMKGDLESDETYLRDNENVKGFFFIIFLALRIRFRILKVLKDHNLLGKVSVYEIIFELSKMEGIVERSGAEYFAAVPKRIEKTVDLFKDMIYLWVKLGGVQVCKIVPYLGFYIHVNVKRVQVFK